MQDYSGDASNYPTSIRIPEDGVDNRNATVSAAGLEDLADRTAHIAARTPGVASVTTYAIPLSTAFTNGAVWGHGTSFDRYWIQNAVSTGRLILDVTAWLPQICNVSGFGFAIRPPGGRTGTDMPVRPEAELLRRPFNSDPGSDWTRLALVGDPTGDGPPLDVEAYQIPHVFGMHGMTQGVDKATAYKWAIALTGEIGTHATTGLIVTAGYVQVGTP